MDEGLTSLTADDLIGTWRLLEWGATSPDGTITRPFGDQPAGYVVYTADGRMITTISRADRDPVGGSLLSATSEASAAAFASFISYAGTFRIDSGDVVHSVEMSLYPDWVGSEQRRRVELGGAGSELALSTELASASGQIVRHRLRWERVTG